MKSFFARPYKNLYIRLIGFVLVLLLSVENFSLAAEIKPYSFTPTKDLSWAQNLFSWMPDTVAKVEDAWKAQGSSQTVILMQDAHTNFSGQRNIAKALDLLLSQGFRKDFLLTPYVFLEAGSGNESLSYLRKRASKKILQQVSESFMRQGLMQGAEYLDINSEHSVTLWGVEDMSLYDESLRLYQQVLKKKDAYQAYLDKTKLAIDSLSEQIYNPVLLSFVRDRQKTQSDQMSLSDYFSRLLSLGAEFSISTASYPHLRSFQKIRQMESQINFPKAEKEQADLIRQLDPDFRKEILDRQKAQKISYENHNLTHVTILKERASEKLKSYPDLEKYIDYAMTVQKINFEKILREAKAMEEKVLEALYVNEDERALWKCSKQTDLLQKILSMNAMPEEYLEYQKDKTRWDMKHITGFLNQKIKSLGKGYERAVFLERGFEGVIQKSEKFYELTYQRDEAFLRNMEVAPGKKNNISILITGGYHTTNLKSLLKQKNISYIVLTPRIFQETNTRRYESLLLGQKSVLASNALHMPINRPQASFSKLMLQRIPHLVIADGRMALDEFLIQIGSSSVTQNGARLAIEEVKRKYQNKLDELKKFMDELQVLYAEDVPDFEFGEVPGGPDFYFEKNNGKISKIIFDQNRVLELSDTELDKLWVYAYEAGWYQDAMIDYSNELLEEDNTLEYPHYSYYFFNKHMETMKYLLADGEFSYKDKKILELAAGAGSLTAAFTQLGAQVTAVDSSGEFVTRAKDYLRREGLEAVHIQDKLVDLNAIPDNQFDLAAIQNTLYLFPPELRKWIIRRAMHKVKAGGKILVIETLEQAHHGGWFHSNPTTEELAEAFGVSGDQIEFKIVGPNSMVGRSILIVTINDRADSSEADTLSELLYVYPELLPTIAGTKPTVWAGKFPGPILSYVKKLNRETNLGFFMKTFFNKTTTPQYIRDHQAYLERHGMHIEGEGEKLVRSAIFQWHQRFRRLVRDPKANDYLNDLWNHAAAGEDMFPPSWFELIHHPDNAISREAISLIAIEELLIGYTEAEADERGAIGGGSETVREKLTYLEGERRVREALEQHDFLDVVEQFRKEPVSVSGARLAGDDYGFDLDAAAEDLQQHANPDGIVQGRRGSKSAHITDKYKYASGGSKKSKSKGTRSNPILKRTYTPNRQLTLQSLWDPRKIFAEAGLHPRMGSDSQTLANFAKTLLDHGIVAGTHDARVIQLLKADPKYSGKIAQTFIKNDSSQIEEAVRSGSDMIVGEETLSIETITAIRRVENGDQTVILNQLTLQPEDAGNFERIMKKATLALKGVDGIVIKPYFTPQDGIVYITPEILASLARSFPEKILMPAGGIFGPRISEVLPLRWKYPNILPALGFQPPSSQGEQGQEEFRVEVSRVSREIKDIFLRLPRGARLADRVEKNTNQDSLKIRKLLSLAWKLIEKIFKILFLFFKERPVKLKSKEVLETEAAEERLWREEGVYQAIQERYRIPEELMKRFVEVTRNRTDLHGLTAVDELLLNYGIMIKLDPAGAVVYRVPTKNIQVAWINEEPIFLASFSAAAIDLIYHPRLSKIFYSGLSTKKIKENSARMRWQFAWSSHIILFDSTFQHSLELKKTLKRISKERISEDLSWPLPRANNSRHYRLNQAQLEQWARIITKGFRGEDLQAERNLLLRHEVQHYIDFRSRTQAEFLKKFLLSEMSATLAELAYGGAPHFSLIIRPKLMSERNDPGSLEYANVIDTLYAAAQENDWLKENILSDSIVENFSAPEKRTDVLLAKTGQLLGLSAGQLVDLAKSTYRKKFGVEIPQLQELSFKSLSESKDELEQYTKTSLRVRIDAYDFPLQARLETIRDYILRLAPKMFKFLEASVDEPERRKEFSRFMMGFNRWRSGPEAPPLQRQWLESLRLVIHKQIDPNRGEGAHLEDLEVLNAENVSDEVPTLEKMASTIDRVIIEVQQGTRLASTEDSAFAVAESLSPIDWSRSLRRKINDSRGQPFDGAEIIDKIQISDVDTAADAHLFVLDPAQVEAENVYEEEVLNRSVSTVQRKDNLGRTLSDWWHVASEPQRLILATNSHQGLLLQKSTVFIHKGQLVSKSGSLAGFLEGEDPKPINGMFSFIIFDTKKAGIVELELRDGVAYGIDGKPIKQIPFKEGFGGVPLIREGIEQLGKIRFVQSQPVRESDELGWPGQDHRLAMTIFAVTKTNKILILQIKGDPNDSVKKEPALKHVVKLLQELGRQQEDLVVTDAIIGGTSADVQAVFEDEYRWAQAHQGSKLQLAMGDSVDSRIRRLPMAVLFRERKSGARLALKTNTSPPKQKPQDKGKAIEYIRTVLKSEMPVLYSTYERSVADPSNQTLLDEARERVYEIQTAHFQVLGLGQMIDRRASPYFHGSYREALQAAFPELHLELFGFGPDWSTEDMAINSSRYILTKYIPSLIQQYDALGDNPGTQDVADLQEEVYALSTASLRFMGLDTMFNKKFAPYFEGSYITALQHIFPKLKLNPLGFQLDYSTKDRALESLRYAIEKNRPDIILDYKNFKSGVNPSSISDLKEKILSIKFSHFELWGVSNITNKRVGYFSSYMDALIEAFPKLEIKKKEFEDYRKINNRKKFGWKPESQGIANIEYAFKKEMPSLWKAYQELGESPSTDQVERLRNQFYKLAPSHFGVWGIAAALNKVSAPYFDGHFYRAMNRVFPKLQLDPLGFQLDWSTRSRSIASIQYVLRRKRPDLVDRYEAIHENSPAEELQRLRYAFYQIDAGTLLFYGLSRITNKSTLGGFDSYVDALRAAYPKLDLNPLGFFFTFASETGSIESIQFALSQHRPDLIEGYKEFINTRREDLKKELQQKIYKISAGHIGLWHLQQIFDVSYFNRSHVTALQRTFPLLDLNPLGFQLDWTTKEKAIISIRYVLSEYLPGLVEQYDALQSNSDNSEREALKAKVSTIKRSQLIEWGLASAFNEIGRPYFGRVEPHKALLKLTFPLLDLQDKGARLAENVTFIIKAESAQPVSGRRRFASRSMAVGEDIFTLREDRSGNLHFYTLGKKIHTVLKANQQVFVKSVENSRKEITMPMSELKIILQKAYDIVENSLNFPELDDQKVVGIIDIGAMNPGSQTFQALTLPLLIQRLKKSQNRPWGKNARFVIKGPHKIVEQITSQVPGYAVRAKDDLDGDFQSAPDILITNSKGIAQSGRHFFFSTPEEGDLLNLGAILKGAISTRRIKELEAANTDYMRMVKFLSDLRGQDVDARQLAIAIDNPKVLDVQDIEKGFSVPSLTRLAISAIMQAYRLAKAMAEQSA